VSVLEYCFETETFKTRGSVVLQLGVIHVLVLALKGSHLLEFLVDVEEGGTVAQEVVELQDVAVDVLDGVLVLLVNADVQAVVQELLEVLQVHLELPLLVEVGFLVLVLVHGLVGLQFLPQFGLQEVETFFQDRVEFHILIFDFGVDFVDFVDELFRIFRAHVVVSEGFLLICHSNLGFE